MLSPHYSFLLRLWQAGTDEHPAWRASLEDPHTHQLTGFDSLEALLAHLRALEQNQGRPQPSPLPGPTDQT